MKGLFSTGAALKMAAVAVTATVAGTNAVVHSVAHRTARVQAQRAALRPLVVPAMTSARPATPIRASAHVATHAVHAKAGVDTALIGSVATTKARPTIVEDAVGPAPAAAPTQQVETAPAPAVESVQSAPLQTGSPSGPGSSTAASFDGHGPAKGVTGNSGSTTGKVRGTSAAHDDPHGPFSPPDTSTTDTTTTTDSTGTTETTTTSSDDTTTTTTTTTDTGGTGGGSSGSANDGGGHGQGHDNGNSGGNGGGNGHHDR
jgi:hypothetical protein